jgi:hypothetical protein
MTKAKAEQATFTPADSDTPEPVEALTEPPEPTDKADQADDPEHGYIGADGYWRPL